MAKVRLKTTTRTQRAASPIPQPPAPSAAGRIAAVLGWLVVLLAVGGTIMVALARSEEQKAYQLELTAAHTAATTLLAEHTASQEAELAVAREDLATAKESLQDAEARRSDAEARLQALQADTDRQEPQREISVAYGPDPYQTPWGRYPDLRLRLERLQQEEMGLKAEVDRARQQAAIREKQVNPLKIQLIPPSSHGWVDRRNTPQYSYRSFKFSVRNIDRERTTPLTLYHIAFARLSDRKPRFYLMHNHRKEITLEPQEEYEWKVPDLRVHAKSGRVGYQGYVILIIDETGQVLHNYTSGSYFREDGPALMKVPLYTAIDNHGVILDDLSEEELALIKFKDEE